MTHEEAIEYLKKADVTVYQEPKTKTAEALEMAIESLKHIPCYLDSPCEYQNPDIKIPHYKNKWRTQETDVSEVLRTLEKLYNDYLIRPDECKALDWAMNFIREHQQDGLEKLVKDCENRLHERM